MANKVNQENQTDGGLTQNAAFIRDTYRKAVITGMLSILSVNINVFVDGILVGRRIGPEALAAINLSLPVYLALCVIGSFLAAGTEIPAARAIGIGDAETRDSFFRTGLNVSVLASAFVTALALLFRQPLVSFLCADEAARGYVMQYVVITVIGALPKILIYIPFWYLRLDGKNTDVTVMMGGMTVTNIVLDILFVYELDMSVFGAGLASVIATALACLYGMIRLFSKDSPYSWRAETVRTRDKWLAIAAAGFPSAFSNLCSTVRLLIVNSMLLASGGAGLVAVFTAVNGIWGFGECVTLGVPVAGGAMLGVFSGERDNGSCRLLLREEWKIGCVSGCVFLGLCAALSPLIPRMYGLSGSIFVPLMWMALSVFPALFLQILTTFYNMSGRNGWANALIFFRVIVMTCVTLWLAIAAKFSTFSFLLFSELGTVLVWWGAAVLRHRRHAQDSRYLMTDLANEKSGKVLNFSVDANVDEIVSASERISGFCSANGMDRKETMRLEMSMEEVMTLIREVNASQGGQNLRFDLRAYSVNGVRGIRIRYSGIPFNPFCFSPGVGGDSDDMYMGVRMIKKMVEMVNYQSAFGVNTLQIILKEDHKNEA
jgi:Na+-driven multidrug efflux pump